ncbi:MAG: HD-GYP domain-containing protein [Acidiferrobacterales bacterium]
MKIKIPVEQLRVGMHVTDLERPQFEGAPLFRGLTIRSQTQIDKLKRHCTHVYVDVAESTLFPATRRPASGKWPPSKPFTPEHQKQMQFEILKLGAAPSDGGSGYQLQTNLEEEINNVSGSYREAKAVIDTTMEDARQGKRINATHVRKVVMEMVASVHRNPNGLICLAQLKDKNDYTALHSVRTCIFALVLGHHLGLDDDDLSALGIGVLLQDIGKTMMPSELLRKPERLNDQEFEVVKSHVSWGVQILLDTDELPELAIDVARYHHERCDGSGYIHGLDKDQIPQFGQIGAIVDCYDALTCDRPYATAISPHDALTRIYEWRHTKYGTVLVEQFIQCMGIYPIGSVVELNTGDVGVVVTINRKRRLRPRVKLVLRPDKTPYKPPKSMNLMKYTTHDGLPIAIERVLEPGAFGIKPIDYLPLTPSD